MAVYSELVRLSLCLITSVALSAGQDVQVTCFKDLPMQEQPCPAEAGSVLSYAACCAQDEANTTRYTLEGQCLTCGPVLNENLFIPQSAQGDNTIVHINWVLHASSRPVTRFLITIGLLDGEGSDVTQIPVVVSNQTNPPNRQQFTPVDPEKVYLLTIRAVDDSGNVSPEISVVWSALEETLPTFSNFTHTPLLAGSVTATWVLLTPGVRPLEQVVIRWVEEASFEAGDDPTDSSFFPLENIAIMNYDITNPDEVLKSGHVFTHTFEGLVAGEAYSVAVNGTSILGSKTSLFRIRTESVEVQRPGEQPLGNTALQTTGSHKVTVVSLLLLLLLQALPQVWGTPHP